MIDREIDIATADGAMNTFITHPQEGGPHPLVLFLMDAPANAKSYMRWRADSVRRVIT